MIQEKKKKKRKRKKNSFSPFSLFKTLSLSTLSTSSIPPPLPPLAPPVDPAVLQLLDHLVRQALGRGPDRDRVAPGGGVLDPEPLCAPRRARLEDGDDPGELDGGAGVEAVAVAGYGEERAVLAAVVEELWCFFECVLGFWREREEKMTSFSFSERGVEKLDGGGDDDRCFSNGELEPVLKTSLLRCFFCCT